MKEEDLMKAIELKKKLDNERELLEFANSHYVDLRVSLESMCDHGRIHFCDINLVAGTKLFEFRDILISIFLSHFNNLLNTFTFSFTIV